MIFLFEFASPHKRSLMPPRVCNFTTRERERETTSIYDRRAITRSEARFVRERAAEGGEMR